MDKFLRCRSTKKYWRMFRNTMGKVYRKLSNKRYPMNVYILNKLGVKGRKRSSEFYKVLKYLFKRQEIMRGRHYPY